MALHIRAITLDLDDTLWPIWPALEQAERDLDAYLRQHYPKVARAWPINALRELRLQVARERQDLAHDFTEQRRLTLRTAFAACGCDNPPLDALWRVFARARNRVELYPDALPALLRLKTHQPLVSLTNGNADLTRIGLHKHFVHHVSARECGWAKPDARIFAVAAARLGLPQHEILHVGDDPALDMAGARAAGLRSAWINREGRVWPGTADTAPDLNLPDLGALADWIETQVDDMAMV